MELLKGRPMAYAGIAALTAAAIGWYFNGTVKLCLAAAALVSLAVWSILRIARVASGRIASRGILASAAALLVLLGAFRFYDIKYLGAQELCGSEHEFAVRILGRRDGGYGSGFDIRITEADGTAMSVRARLTVEGTTDFRAGNTVRLRCTPVPFEKTPSYDGERAALADGILLELTADEDVAYVMTDTSEAGGLLGFFSRLGSDLSFRLREAVGGDEGALAAAMLLGDRSGLPDAAARDFSRAGVSHLLALSGLHLSAVAGAVGWLLTKLRLPKLAKTPLMSVFLLLYLAVVGFPLSAVRAAIMLFAVFAAYYSGADGDGAAITPLADSYGIPREKTAFVIRSSAVASATLWPLGAWVVFVAVLLETSGFAASGEGVIEYMKCGSFHVLSDYYSADWSSERLGYYSGLWQDEKSGSACQRRRSGCSSGQRQGNGR